MNITEQITADIKTAMKAKDMATLQALRDIKSKLMLEMTKDGSDGIDEGVGIQILNKLYKQRVDAAAIYKEQGRADLHDEEMQQAEVIKQYLPEQLSPEKLQSTVEEIVARVGASSMADMGKVMGIASKELAGKADGKDIANVVRALLG
ncbi:GatB/YqeY domain-containing protein [Sanyastnella coralliicola]|uniref:GatB/YqeY domain-containing protein n=1 Tax=Sanyastnella coralliicola TaxID=3069118 RepID=UPI0027B9B841|nr:GatB/YqeY domain-containing protein [Longitalea sp. SCSIO 12813]